MNSGGFSAFARPGPLAFATAATNSTTSPGSVFGQPAFGSSYNIWLHELGDAHLAALR